MYIYIYIMYYVYTIVYSVYTYFLLPIFSQLKLISTPF